MNIFIDANIFLSFYHLTSEDLEELEKLVHLISTKKVTLYLPQQVIDETLRNRANKIKDKFDTFIKEKISPIFPAYCKDYSEYKDLQEILSNAQKKYKDLVQKIQEDIHNNNLKADKVIQFLFDSAHIIGRNKEIRCKFPVKQGI